MPYVLSLSGGLDSCTLLGNLLRQCDANEILCVSFKYGSKHNQYENEAAQKIAKYYGVNFIEIDITPIMTCFKSDLLLSGGEIPEGHYQADNMKSTVVPCRNMIFASILAGIAESSGASTVALGVNCGDHAIYPDCRASFIYSMNKTTQEATDKKVKIIAPFLLDTKETIVHFGMKIRSPYHLTRTCYKNQEIACGKCGSCIERLEAFAQNNAVDPIEYEKEVVR